MSKSSNPSRLSDRSRLPILQSRGLSMLAATGVLVAFVLGGCSQDQRDNWTWNQFKKESKATPPDAGSKARRPAPPAPPATASNTPRNNPPATADDQKAEKVNNDVGNYANSFPQDRNAPKSRTPDSGTPTIDDDRPLAAASTSPRATRTSARPAAPTPPPQSPAPASPSSGQGDELVLMPTDSGTTASSTGQPGISSIDANDSPNMGHSSTPSNTSPEPTSIAMAPIGENRQPSESMTEDVAEDTTHDNGRPPVLGSVEISAGNDSDSASSAGNDSTPMTGIKDAPTITPTPIRPIESDKPVNPTPPAPIKSVPPEVTEPIKPTAPPTPKKEIEESKPKPAATEVTPFEDRPETPPPVKAQPVTPESVKPAPIETKPQEAPKPANPPADITPPAPKPAEATRSLNTPAREIADMESIVLRQPNNIDQQLKLRMRYLEQGDEASALRPTPGMSEDIERTVIAQIRSVIAAKSSDGRTAPEAANKQLVSAEAIRAGAAAKADLQVPRVKLCTAIRAFGDYTPIDPPTFTAGKNDKVLVYIEIENFMSKQMDDGQYKTVLTLRESLLDARGRELWSLQNPPIEDISRQMRRDFFLSTSPRPISAKLPPGEYFYKVEIEDVQAGKVNSAKTGFKLVAVGKN